MNKEKNLIPSNSGELEKTEGFCQIYGCRLKMKIQLRRSENVRSVV